MDGQLQLGLAYGQQGVKNMKRILLSIFIVLLLCSNVFAWEQIVGTSKLEQLTDKFRFNKAQTAPTKVLPLSSTCTIGTDCDTTSVDIANGGLIFSTATITITLPEIVTSPSTAIQVPIGANLCFYQKDNNEVLTITPNAGDSITLGGTKGAAGVGVKTGAGAITGAGDYVCLVAVEADNWMIMGTGGTGSGVVVVP